MYKRQAHTFATAADRESVQKILIVLSILLAAALIAPVSYTHLALAAAGQSLTAQRAATPLMKPSISTGTPSSAPPRKTPQRPDVYKRQAHR